MARTIRPAQEIKIINSVPRMVKETFTVRFAKADEAPMWMQEGAVFDESGNEVESPPDWIWAEFAKLSDEAKTQLAMTVPAAGKAK